MTRGDKAPGRADPGKVVGATRTRLIEHGFAGTDTNRIARRAGFAPQTFYRWFSDKAAVFAEVLHVWEEAEFALFMSLLGPHELTPLQLAEACVENMRPFLTFRQHLRSVTLQDAAVRAVRGQGRAALMSRLGPWCAHLAPESLAHTLLQIESLSEMLARGDLSDLGVSGSETLQALADHIRALRPAGD